MAVSLERAGLPKARVISYVSVSSEGREFLLLRLRLPAPDQFSGRDVAHLDANIMIKVLTVAQRQSPRFCVGRRDLALAPPDNPVVVIEVGDGADDREAGRCIRHVVVSSYQLSAVTFLWSILSKKASGKNAQGKNNFQSLSITLENDSFPKN